jgi:hypothetical protein
MAKVFEEIMRPNKRSEVIRSCIKDRKILELQTAKEILAEVFSLRVSDVDEMIQNRYEKDDFEI